MAHSNRWSFLSSGVPGHRNPQGNIISGPSSEAAILRSGLTTYNRL